MKNSVGLEVDLDISMPFDMFCDAGLYLKLKGYRVYGRIFDLSK